MTDDLTNAVNQIDLPALVSNLFPASGAKPGRGGSIKATWRDEENPSASLFRSNEDGAWLVKDHATEQVFNAFQFLVDVAGYSEDAAKEYIFLITGNRRPNIFKKKDITATQKPQSCEDKVVDSTTEQKLLAQIARTEHVPLALDGRGFTVEDLKYLGVAASKDDAVLAIRNAVGELVAIKKKFYRGRYQYCVANHGAPAWMSPAAPKSTPSRVLVIEGELNAMAAHLVTKELGLPLRVMGVAGASSRMNLPALVGKTVFILADNDEAGEKASTRWSAEAKSVGAKEVHRLEPFPPGIDTCDYMGEHGKERLGKILKAKIEAAYRFNGLVGGYSRAELRNSALRFLSGEILVPTGFKELDRETGGLPESGVVLIGGVSSVGKSVLLRDIAYNHVMSGKKAVYFSPDQGVPALCRLYTSKVSRVSMRSLRQGNLTADEQEMFGGNDVEAAKAQWQKAYKVVTNELMAQFFINDADVSMPTIVAQAQQAVDRGASIIFADYLQLFTPEKYRGGFESVAEVAKQFKVLARQLRVPIVIAAQLAKSRFGTNTHRGTPFPTMEDIEGAGSIHHVAEQIFLIYRWKLHESRFGDGVSPENDGMSELNRARIIVGKNKEDRSDYHVLLEFYDYIPDFGEINYSRGSRVRLN